MFRVHAKRVATARKPPHTVARRTPSGTIGMLDNGYDGVVRYTKKKKDDMNHSLRPPENNLVNVGVNQCNDTKYCHNNSYRQHHCCFKI